MGHLCPCSSRRYEVGDPVPGDPFDGLVDAFSPDRNLQSRAGLDDAHDERLARGHPPQVTELHGFPLDYRQGRVVRSRVPTGFSGELKSGARKGGPRHRVEGGRQSQRRPSWSDRRSLSSARHFNRRTWAAHGVAGCSIVQNGGSSLGANSCRTRHPWPFVERDVLWGCCFQVEGHTSFRRQTERRAHEGSANSLALLAWGDTEGQAVVVRAGEMDVVQQP